MEEGSGLVKTGKYIVRHILDLGHTGPDLTPGVPALHSLVSQAALEVEILIIPNQALSQGVVVEIERMLDHDPRFTVEDQTLLQQLGDHDLSHRIILKHLQLYPRDLQAVIIVMKGIQRKLQV